MKTINTYKLRISYDGTAYQGWQVQPNGPTVAATLQEAFTRTFNHQLSMVGASRTDSGVHAFDQVARVRTDLTIDAARLHHAWNNALPSDIVIRELTAVDASFHPHHNVGYKEYEYCLFTQRPLPFEARFGWWPEQYAPLFDAAVFEKTLQLFVGTHDFTAFSKDEPGREQVRAVDAMTVLVDGHVVKAIIRGKGFLRYQIRRMIGAAIMVASNAGVTAETVARLLAHPQGDPAHMMLNADARGLCLQKIMYTE